MKNYTIYVGRFCVARFAANSLIEATEKWNAIADELKKDGTCTLYEGKRAIENECAKQIITDTAARAKGGSSRWSGMTKKERSEAMKAVRKGSSQNDPSAGTAD